MSDTPQTTAISALGEFGLIDRWAAKFPISNKHTVKGIGDDAAVLSFDEKKVVVTTDMLVEEVHFDMHYTPLRHLGYKAVIVNLSDIYAMNATPTQITVSLAISSKYSIEALDELYEGIAYACEKYGVDLIGGDTTASTKGLIISITALGTTNTDKIVYRNGAKEGDLICVTGTLGAAYLGLQLLEREKKIFIENPGLEPDFENADALIHRFLKPEAQKDIIAYFEEVSLLPTAMIDLSDGLSSDLMHICKQSDVGAKIYESQIPMLEEVFTVAEKFGIEPITCALNGGEDYELLFTISPEDETKINAHPDISIIGQIAPKHEGLKLLTAAGNEFNLKAQGWNHFQR